MTDKVDKFWTMKRRSYLYSVALSLVPMLVALGLLTGDVAQVVLNVIAAVLAVGSGSMALSNLTPDDTIYVSMRVDNEDDLG